VRRVFLGVVLGLVGVALFATILALIGPGAVAAQLRALGWPGFLAMGANDLLATAFWVLSWGVLLRGYGIRLGWGQVAGASAAGFALSYLTPVAYVGGEPVRAWLVTTKSGRSWTTAFASLFVDRLLAGVCLVLFALLGGGALLSSNLLGPQAKVQVGVALFLVTLAVALGLLSFARNYGWLSRIVAALGRLRRTWSKPQRWAERIRQMESEVYLAFSRNWATTALAFLLQLLSFVCTYLRPQIFFYFAEGRLFSFPQLAAYFNLNAILTTVLWLTPAGLGTAEGGRIGILGLVGIVPATALAFSLTVRFLELLVVGGGLLYLFREGVIRLTLPAQGRARPKAFWGTVRGALEVGSLWVYGYVLPTRYLPRLFAWRYRRPDPWDYASSPYEKVKYERKLAILPRKPNPEDPPYARALDVGCGEGFFSALLAERGAARHVVGLDFAPPALERGRARWAHLKQLEFVLMDASKELPDGQFDLVVCSEVLYYLGRGNLRKLAHRIASRVSMGGHVVLVSAWPAGRVIHRPFVKLPGFSVVEEHVELDSRRPYLITCLERRLEADGPGRCTGRRAPLSGQSWPGTCRW